MLWLVVAVLACTAHAQDEDSARAWLVDYNAQAQVAYSSSYSKTWDYQTNITSHNQQIAANYSSMLADFDKEAAQNASGWDWQNFQNELTRREFYKIADLGTSTLPKPQYDRLQALGGELTNIYNTATVCNRPNDSSGTCYPLDPDLTQILATSRDWDELVWAWEGWRNASGRNMPDTYEEYMSLQNMAAQMNGYVDAGEYWRSAYEMSDLQQQCENLWGIIKPLYEQLHAYVRKKLREHYVNQQDQFPSTGQIPAHILGNMWAQSWQNVEDIVRPFPDKPGFDVTEEMVRQNYTVQGMFEMSEEFFTSLGLIEMPDSLWNDSMVVRPSDGRSVACHASAWDFRNQVDFRIKQCTEINHNWLITTHHEMGHVEYYLQYKDQPVKFRRGGNPGFHEAIGDVMALSVNTPEHLFKVGLISEVTNDPETDLNFLMNQALKKLVFIPFGYLIDQWRWDIFSGTTDRANYNSAWWADRCNYQGVSPPTQRTATDFDAGSKYHIPANTPYIRYFVSHVIQFQFYEALCNASGWTGPLHRCDFYQSAEAGQLIGNMMQLGSSAPWQDAMEQIAGIRTMDSRPLVNYFQPLLDWLQEQNVGETIGWDPECPNVPPPARRES